MRKIKDAGLVEFTTMLISLSILSLIHLFRRKIILLYTDQIIYYDMPRSIRLFSKINTFH